MLHINYTNSIGVGSFQGSLVGWSLLNQINNFLRYKFNSFCIKLYFSNRELMHCQSRDCRCHKEYGGCWFQLTIPPTRSKTFLCRVLLSLFYENFTDRNFAPHPLSHFLVNDHSYSDSWNCLLVFSISRYPLYSSFSSWLPWSRSA